MRNREPSSPLAELFLPLALLVVPVLLFWNAFTMQGAFFYGDIMRIYYPMKVALDRALTAGQLPLWTSNVMAGYPLLGEGEGGFLYPLGLFLSSVFSPVGALNYQVLIHLAIAGLGTYAFCRLLGLDAPSAAVGGLTFMLSGFAIAHLDHISILSAIAWLPLLFLLAELLVTRPRPGVHAALLGLVVGLQLSVGHAQVSFMSLLALSLYALFRAAGEFLNGEGLGRPARLLGFYVLAVLLGAGLAAPQLLPTLELTEVSQRGGGLSTDFLTSFSLPPPYVITFLFPFIGGNPLTSANPATVVEWCGYVGILPLFAAAYACFFRRDRYTLFFLLLAVLGLALALGQFNPLYGRLARLPGFNLFRAPARFLLLYSFAIAALGALGFHSLRHPGLPSSRSQPWLIPAAGVAVLAIWMLAIWDGLELTRLVSLWQFLPWALLAVALALVVARGRLAIGSTTFSILGAALLTADLYAFATVFGYTFNATAPLAMLTAPPRVSAILGDQDGPYRVYTRERIVPWAVGIRESLFPNYSLAWDVASLNGYLPLTTRIYQEFAEKVATSAPLANLANVKYLLIPQSVGDDEAVERDNLANPYSPSPVGQQVAVPPTPTAALEVESFTSNSVDVPDGEVVADIVVSDGTGEQVFPLREGVETGEWAYDRPDVRQQIKHKQPQIIREWPASAGLAGPDFRGYTYTARLALSAETKVTSVEVRLRPTAARLHVDRIVLVDAAGKRTPLSHLAGWADYEIAYRSEAVVAYRNRDVLPRVTLVHQARQAASHDDAWQQLLARDFNPAAEVVLEPNQPTGLFEQLLAFGAAPGGGTQAEEQPPAQGDSVQLVDYAGQSLTARVGLATPGYLVVSDAYYPGWQAYVDGRQAPLLRADGLFRAVALPAGEHKVEMRYKPPALGLGLLLAAVSAVGLALLGIVLPWVGRGEEAPYRRPA